MDLFLAIALDRSHRATGRLAQSALPHAPVIAEAAPHDGWMRRTRSLLARSLHRVARALEPTPRPQRVATCGPHAA